ncbi:MAG: D-alanyl-D-alanine carboxypeptidase family protein [Actinomycetota bacterium]|nr:D-alanyl-D-alanine carboxypeptidase family protein [Actinomycetota bacterium]
MTVLVAGLAFLLVASLGSGIASVGAAATARARTQLAADAAALAAVAESAPHGTGRPFEAATEYAQANGARLVDCFCDEGATAMQVSVTVGGAVAEARAVMDPTLLAPARMAGADGLHPQLAAAVDRLLDAAFGRVWIVSGRRTTERQAELWADALEKYGSPEAADDWVAPPGSSLHEKGLAVDLGGDLAEAARLVDELGLPLHRPLPHEPHHFELWGSRTGTTGTGCGAGLSC